ncbi:MAG: TolC family protein [Hyphomonas sp.]
MRLLFSAALAIAIAWAPGASAQDPTARRARSEASSILTIQEAVARALERGPASAAAAARLQAADANVDQARALPNPELAVEGENFLGTGQYRSFESLETTFSVSQTVEIGGKRGARVRAAEADRTAAQYGLSATELGLAKQVKFAFTEAVAAEAAVKLEEEGIRLAHEVERSVRAQVEAGRETLVQLNRAEVALSQAELQLDRARRRTALARDILGSLAGIDPATIQLESSWFEQLDPVGDLPSTDIDGSIDVLQSEAEVLRSRTKFEMERRQALPDLTVSAGVRRFSDSNDSAFVFGVSIPIPVFDRRQGAIRRARAEIVAAEADLAASRLGLTNVIAAVRSRIYTARDKAVALRTGVLPKAEQAFIFAEEGYRQGKFSYLDVLDAQRTLFQGRRELLDTLQTLHEARAELERLTGTSSERNG